MARELGWFASSGMVIGTVGSSSTARRMPLTYSIKMKRKSPPIHLVGRRGSSALFIDSGRMILYLASVAMRPRSAEDVMTDDSQYREAR